MYERYGSIFAKLEPPFAFVDLDAVGANAGPRISRRAEDPRSAP
jgi:hypothetical protein